VREVSTRLGISIDSLYAWVRGQCKVSATRQADVYETRGDSEDDENV
jgi:hypothetical protein